MTPHRTLPGTTDTPMDRRGSGRPSNDDEGIEHRRPPRSSRWSALYASRVARAAIVLAGLGGMVFTALSSLGFISSTPSSRITALATVVTTNSQRIDRESQRTDSLGHAVDSRFESMDDRLTFMNYLLCQQSSNLAPPARSKCDTIIQRRLSP